MESGKGGNLDFPFPFRTHAKVTVEKNGPAFFYQVGYRKYLDSRTDVRTYSAAALSATLLDAVRAQLTGSPALTNAVGSTTVELTASSNSLELTASPGGEAVVALQMRPSRLDVVTVQHRAQPFDGGSYYFHADWAARGPMPTRPYRDLQIARIAGTGAYVGTSLSIGNSSSFWWGEGDDRISVDGEGVPGWLGTGSEDYVGTAYCSSDAFSHPYRALSFSPGGFAASP